MKFKARPYAMSSTSGDVWAVMRDNKRTRAVFEENRDTFILETDIIAEGSPKWMKRIASLLNAANGLS